MSFGRFDTPYFTGASTVLEVPYKYDVALNGRPYMLYTYPDTPYERRPAYTRRPIQLLAPQQDSSGGFGERSLSNEELVRRSQDSWDHGSGQTFFDRDDSDNRRFRTSKGVDVWERWALKLLPDTAQKRASGNTNLTLAVAGTRLYVTDGAGLQYTPDLTTWTGVTGLPTTHPSSLVTDGLNVWTAHGTDGVYVTTRTTGTAAQSNLLTATVLGYEKGRLMAGVGPALFNITNYASTTAPTALWTHPNNDWTWVGFAESPTGIYAAGFSADKSEVYQVGIKTDGTGLNIPVVAAVLPDGEVVRAIGSYLGYVLLGTDRGVRFCAVNSDGTLTLGALTPATSPVRCFEGQDRFVWYGLTNYDSASTGLGRMDLSVFINALEPAYASDLMVTGQGTVLSVVTFLNNRVFAISGLGVYTETVNKVSSGTLDTGLITYGLPDPKVAMYVDVKVRTLTDTNRAYVSVDSGPFTLIGARSTASIDPFPVGQKSGEVFEVRHELVNSDTDMTAGPVVTRWTLRAYPKPHQGEQITMSLDLNESQLNAQDGAFTLDPQAEYELIRALQASRQLVQLQIEGEALTVLVDAHQFNATTRTSTSRGWNGICELSVKALAI